HARRPNGDRRAVHPRSTHARAGAHHARHREALRRRQGTHRRRLLGQRGRGRGIGRRQRRRQVDPREDPRRRACAGLRHGGVRRRAGRDPHARRCAGARHRHRLPGSRAVRQPRRRRQPVARARARGHGNSRRGRDGAAHLVAAAGAGGEDPVRAAAGGIPVRRAAADRRDRTLPRGRPARGHPRRADGRARRRPDGRSAQPHRAPARARARRDPDQPQHGRCHGRRRPGRRAAARPQQRRLQRRGRHQRDPHRRHHRSDRPRAQRSTPARRPAGGRARSADHPADADPAAGPRRMTGVQGVRDRAELLVARVRGGDLGSLPVIVGVIVIWTVFQILNPVFLSSTNLVNLTMQCAAIGTIALGVVLVLLVGEIDLSVGSVAGVAAAVLAVSFVQLQWNAVLAVIAALAIGCLIGLLYGYLLTRFGLPSFVVTLAGLLGFLGLQLWVLGETGSINLPFDSWIVRFAQQMFLPPWASYALAVVAAGLYALSRLRRARQRTAASLISQSYAEIAVRSAALLAFLLVAAWYLNLSRGVGVMFLLFLLLVVAANFALTRTRWGRAVYAVGGSVEAARRA